MFPSPYFKSHLYGRNDFDMQKVLPLKRWKKHKLPAREHFSDQDSDSEDECLDDEAFEIPRNERKSKRKPKPEFKPKSKPAKKRKIRIPKEDIVKTTLKFWRACILALFQSGFERMRLNRLRLLPENKFSYFFYWL